MTDTVTIDRNEYERLLKVEEEKIEPVASDEYLTQAAAELAHTREHTIESALFDDVINEDNKEYVENKEKQRIEDINTAVKEIYQKHFTEGAEDKLENVNLQLMLKSLQEHFTQLNKMSSDFYNGVIPWIYNPKLEIESLGPLEEIHGLVGEYRALMNAYLQAYRSFIDKYMGGGPIKNSDRVDNKIKELNERINKIQVVFCNIIRKLPEIDEEAVESEIYSKYETGLCKQLLEQQRVEYQNLPWYKKVKLGASNLVQKISKGGKWILDSARKLFTRKFMFLSAKHFYRNAIIYYTIYTVLYGVYDNWENITKEGISSFRFLIEFGFAVCKSIGGNPFALGSIGAKLSSTFLRSITFTLISKRLASMIGSVIGNAVSYLGSIYIYQWIKDLSSTIIGTVCETIRLSGKTGLKVVRGFAKLSEDVKGFVEDVNTNGFSVASLKLLSSKAIEGVSQGMVSVLSYGAGAVTNTITKGYQKFGNIINHIPNYTERVQQGASWTYGFITNQFGILTGIKSPNQKLDAFCPIPIPTYVAPVVPVVPSRIRTVIDTQLECGLLPSDYIIWSQTNIVESKITGGKRYIDIGDLLDLITRAGKRIKDSAGQLLQTIQSQISVYSGEVYKAMAITGTTTRDKIVSLSSRYIKPVWERMVAYGTAVQNIYQYYYNEIYALIGITNFFQAIHSDYKFIYSTKETLLKKISQLEETNRRIGEELKRYKITSTGLYYGYKRKKKAPGRRKAQIIRFEQARPKGKVSVIRRK